VSVVYNDHSLYIWDVRDVRKVGKSHSFLFHSACIWGLEVRERAFSASALDTIRVSSSVPLEIHVQNVE